jgi:hypothetical protein
VNERPASEAGHDQSEPSAVAAERSGPIAAFESSVASPELPEPELTQLTASARPADSPARVTTEAVREDAGGDGARSEAAIESTGVPAPEPGAEPETKPAVPVSVPPRAVDSVEPRIETASTAAAHSKPGPEKRNEPMKSELAPTKGVDEPEAAEEIEELEPTGFVGELRSRMIIGSPMDGDVRLTFLLGALTLIVAMAVDVLRGLLGPPIETVAGSIPMGAVAVFAAGQFFAFTLFFRGALQLRRHVRNGVLAATAFVVFAVPAVQDFQLLDLLLIVPIAALWYFADTKDQLTAGASWRPAAASAAGLSATFVLAAVTGNDTILVELAAGGAMLAAVGLFAASTDIAEVAQVGADAIAERIPLRNGALAAFAVLLSALAPFAAGVVVLDLDPVSQPEQVLRAMSSGFGMLLWYALVFWMLVSIGRKRKLVVKPHVPYRTLLGIVALFGIALFAAALTRILADPATYDPGQLFSYAQVEDAGVLLFLGFAILFAIFGRRSAETFVLFGFGATVGVWWFVNFSNQGLTLFEAPLGIAFVTPIVLFVVAAWPKTRDRFTAVCNLIVATNFGIAGYTMVAFLFVAAPAHFEEGSLLQALVVLLALGWDVLTSKNVTLRHSAGVPRNARVSFFIAYVSLVGLFVMLSSASSLLQPGTAKAMEHVFDSETFVAAGLHLFGAPLLLFVFAVRMRSILGTSIAR